MNEIILKCINCGGINLKSVSIETIKIKLYLQDNEWKTENIIPLEHESWKVTCGDCGHVFDESELYEKEHYEIYGELLDD